jgi:hypothetical protein
MHCSLSAFEITRVNKRLKTELHLAKTELFIALWIAASELGMNISKPN